MNKIWVLLIIFQIKSKLNAENKYNQNFDGVYCTCMRPYPDPEGLDNDEMLQCAICEDWYHSKVIVCTTTFLNIFINTLSSQWWN